MKIRLSLSKADKIMALLNQWDPEERYKNGAGAMAYSYEAETIAQEIRSNSKTETIENAIAEAFLIPLDSTEVRQMAVYIKSAVKG